MEGSLVHQEPFNLFVANECAGQPLTSHGDNVVFFNDPAHCTINGSVLYADPVLGPLQHNGGPTWTHALLPGSAAVDAELDLLLGRYFAMSEGFFLRLQNAHDLLEAKRAHGTAIERVLPRLDRAA